MMQDDLSEETFAKQTVIDFIRKYAVVEDVVTIGEYEVFILDNGITIRLPIGFGRVDYEYVRLIADVKLGLSAWEFDYWHGEIGK